MIDLCFNGAAAGILIGLGVIINTLTQNPVLGAFLFSFGLLTIIDLKLPLFTGQIGFIKDKRKTDLLAILICNIIGILFCSLLFFFISNKYIDILTAKALIKFEKTFFEMFIYGVFCGMLIHFAVKSKKQVITSMAVMIFILIGAEHCIADVPYLVANFSFINTIKFLFVVLGNSVGAIFIELLTIKKEF